MHPSRHVRHPHGSIELETTEKTWHVVLAPPVAYDEPRPEPRGAAARHARGRSLRASDWLDPGVELLHIVGFSSLVGSIALFDARLLGAARSLPVSVLGHYLRRWSLASAGVVVPSGLLLFIANATQLANNPVFWVKLLFVGLAAANAASFQLGVHRSVRDWDRDVPAPFVARVHGMVSLASWLGTLACGRWLAYT